MTESDSMPPEPAHLRRRPRPRGRWLFLIIVGSLLGLAMFFVAVAALALAWLETPAGQTWLVARLNRELAAQGIEIAGLRGRLLGGWELERLTLSDEDGPYLRLQEIELQWRPMELLAGDLAIDKLSIEAGRLLRLPQERAAGAVEPERFELPELPRLPLRLRLARFEVAQFALDEPVLGFAAEMKATGEARWTEEERLTADFSLSRLDAEGDRLEIRLAYDQPATTLSLEAGLRGAQGGVFATAIGAPPGEAVALRLSGAGPLSAWQGALAGNIGEKARLGADIAVRDGAVTLEGQADIDALVAPPYAELARPEVGFRLSGGLGRDDALSLEIGLDTAAIALQSTGSLSFAASPRLDFSYRLEVRNAAPLAPVLAGASFARGDISGRVAGDLAAPTLTASGRLIRPRLPEIGTADAAEFTLRTQLGIDAIPLTLEGNVAALRLAGQPLLDPQFAVNGSYHAKEGAIAVDSARASAGGAAIAMRGRLEDDLATISLDGEIEIDELARFAFLPESPLSGGLATTFRIARADRTAPWTLQLEGAGRNIAAASETLSKALGTAPEIALAAKLAPEGRLSLDPLRIRTEGARLEARGPVDLAAERLDLDYTLTIETLAAILGAQPVSAGDSLTIGGRLFGPFADPAAEARTQIPFLEIQGAGLADITATLSARGLTQQLSADLSLAADSRFGAVDLTAAARLPAAGGAELTAMRLTVGTAEIDGRLAVDETGLMRGAFEGRTGSLAELPESRRYGLRGTLSTEVTLAVSDAGKQTITASATADELIVPLGTSEVAEVESFRFSGEATLLEPRPRIEARLAAAGLQIGFARLETLSLDASGGRDALELGFAAEGEWRGPLDLNGTLLWRGDEEDEQVTLAADGTMFGQKTAFSEPARLLLAGDGWRLDPLRIAIGDGGISATARQRPDAFEIDLAAEALPLELVNVAVPDIYPSGDLGGELHLSQAGETVNGTARLSLRNVKPAVSGFARTPPFDFDLAAEIAGNAATLEGSARAEDALDARLSAELPLDIDLIAGTAGLRPEEPMTGRFHWQGALAPLFMVVNLPQHEAYGDFTADLTLGGTPAAPELGGTLEIADARYEHLESGFVAQDLLLSARLEDRRLTVTRLAAEDGEGGTLSGRATVEFAPEALLAEAELDFDRLHLLRRNDLEALASGNLAFVKTAETMLASGRIAPNRVEVDIGRSLPQEVVDIEVIEVETEDALGDPEDASRRPRPQPLRLDLEVDAPQRLFVRGRGLDSEWAANLQITGTAEAPRLQGSARIVKGVFEFAGRRFTLATGELRFVGGETIDPLLDVVARETVDDVQVTLQISGTLSSPSLSMSSTPALPEDEILARILFGESVSGLSALQLVQLASAVSGLSGGGGFDVIGGARGLLGLDRLNITSGNGGEDANGGATIAGGKYLTDSVYLEMSTETGTGVAAGTIEWSLTKSLSLESRVSSGRDNSIRLRWSWNY